MSCAAPNELISGANCYSALKSFPTDNSSTLNLSPLPKVSESTPGKELLSGFLDVEWTNEEESGQKRCVMSIIPDERSYEGIRIVTASHCLPDLTDSSELQVSFTAQIAYRGGYVPLPVRVPTFNKHIRLLNFLKKYTQQGTDHAQLGQWLPELAPKKCIEMSQQFTQKTTEDQSTACFSAAELIILNAGITENDQSKLKKYKELYDRLDRKKGDARDRMPTELRKHFRDIWRSRKMWEIRQRNLKAIAFLSNVQFCNTQQADIDNLPSAINVRTFCDIKPKIIEKLIEETSSDELTAELKYLQSDTQTPLNKLKKMYFSCFDINDDNSEENSVCVTDRRAEKAFTLLVNNAGDLYKNGASLSKDKVSLENYLKITTVHRNESQIMKHILVPLKQHVTRANDGVTDSQGIYLFDYLPNNSGLNFKKGDSGSLLNIYGGYPVAALSTVDREPTSGGAGLTPLPEPQEDDVVESKVHSQDGTRACP